MSKSLILFYSFEGNTKRVGEFLADRLNLPVEEIKPVKDLPSKGFSKYFWGGSQVIMNKKPELRPLNANLDDYDTVFLGSPIWAGTFAPPIKTLLEDGKLKGKRVFFYYSHDGGPGKASIKIKEAVNINNELISSYGLTNIKNNFEGEKDGVLQWAKNLLREYR